MTNSISKIYQTQQQLWSRWCEEYSINLTGKEKNRLSSIHYPVMESMISNWKNDWEKNQDSYSSALINKI